MPSRRSFIASGLAATAAATGWLPHLAASNSNAAKKFSLAAYSYRNLLSGKDASLTLFDFVDDCAKFGLAGTELTSYYFPENPTNDFLDKLCGHVEKKGMVVSGTAIRNNFGESNPETLAGEIEHVKKWVRYAKRMKTDVIRVFAGHHPKGADLKKSHRQMVDCFEQCCEYAGKHGVYLALENHGGPTATADGLLQFINDVKSKWFGVNLDTGNFHTEDIYGDLEKVAPHAVNVQVKVVTSGPDRKKQPADYSRIATILKKTDYQRFVVLEYEEEGDPRIESRRHLDKLRAAFHKG